MCLRDLIEFLEQQDPGKVVPVGFGAPHSYRGYYEDLAFRPMANVKAGEMLDAARSARGATFFGYKGGEYVMEDYTRVFLAHYGRTGEQLGKILLSLMFGLAPSIDEED